MTVLTRDLHAHWQAISPILTIQNEDEYDAAIERLNLLLDDVGTNEAHPLYELLDTLGTLIHVYEEEHIMIPVSSGVDMLEYLMDEHGLGQSDLPEVDMLEYLMDEHGLGQSDLPEVGTQGVVSEILNEKRQLNVRQIRMLAERFCVSPAVFF